MYVAQRMGIEERRPPHHAREGLFPIAYDPVCFRREGQPRRWAEKTNAGRIKIGLIFHITTSTESLLCVWSQRSYLVQRFKWFPTQLTPCGRNQGNNDRKQSILCATRFCPQVMLNLLRQRLNVCVFSPARVPNQGTHRHSPLVCPPQRAQSQDRGRGRERGRFGVDLGIGTHPPKNY